MKQTSIYAAAMQYGLFIGLFLLSKFFIGIIGHNSILSAIVGNFMLMGTPLVAYFVMRSYAANNTEAPRSYTQYWYFGMLIFFFGTLLSGMGQYLYYTYINPLYLSQQLTLATSLIQKMGQESATPFAQSLVEVAAQQGAPSPIEMVIQTLWINTLIGSVIGAFCAILVARYDRLHNKNSNQSPY